VESGSVGLYVQMFTCYVCMTTVSTENGNVIFAAGTFNSMGFELCEAAGGEETVLAMPSEVMKWSAARDGRCGGIRCEDISQEFIVLCRIIVEFGIIKFRKLCVVHVSART